MNIKVMYVVYNLATPLSIFSTMAKAESYIIKKGSEANLKIKMLEIDREH